MSTQQLMQILCDFGGGGSNDLDDDIIASGALPKCFWKTLVGNVVDNRPRIENLSTFEEVQSYHSQTSSNFSLDS